MMNFNILQWNTRGVRNKRDEIMELVQHHQLWVLAIRETKLRDSTEFNITNYNCLRKEGHTNYTTHGGVALFIHSSIPFHPIQLNTPLQAIAARISTVRLSVTLLSLYIPHSQKFSINLLNNILTQLPPPVIIMGDLNSHSQQWGSTATDNRGKIVEEFCNSNNLNILNDGAPTRIEYNTESAIDLSICSPVLQPIMEWSVYASPGASDHCPIIMSIVNPQANDTIATEKYNFRKADWSLYCVSSAWDNIPEDIISDNNQLIEHLYTLFDQASSDSIPKYKPSPFYPKPWWTPELKQSKQNRERLYKIYRRNKSYENMIKWKRSRAEHKYQVRVSKQKSWRVCGNS